MRTLKDIDFGIYNYEDGDPIQILKQEAIKWIKDMQEKNQIERLFSNPNELFYAIVKFKQFFDITEEELNEN